MFSRKNRFSFKNSLPKQILNSQSFSVRYRKNDEDLKVAVVVSKKVDKRATVRNKIRRKILESVQKSGVGNTDLVFYVKKEIDIPEIEKEVSEALSRL